MSSAGARLVELINRNSPIRIFSRPAFVKKDDTVEEQKKKNDDTDKGEEKQVEQNNSQYDERGEYYQCEFRRNVLTVFVFGASGDLAKKKTYPALFSLYKSKYLPETFTVIGYARSEKSDDDFRSGMRKFLTKDGPGDGDANKNDSDIDEFLKHCVYRNGSSYEDEDAFKRIINEAKDMEEDSNLEGVNRLFYFAVPPSVFVAISRVLKKVGVDNDGWNRFILEKPFGHDLQSFEKLNADISSILNEEEIFRIDHYIGKEAVQNLLVMRFANAIYEPLWNRQHVSSVTISFKENFGTKGRGGYFDSEGIIRDVMQNHLLQVMTMFAMEAPVGQTGDLIRDEKVKVLRAMRDIRVEDCILGQYIADDEGKLEAYRDHEKVPDDSDAATYAAMVLYIDNPRWDGVPFIMRAGKALNETKSEVRMQFRNAPGASLLFADAREGPGLQRNELVIRLQPKEAVYMKMNIKSPGLAGDPVLSELDLSYDLRYPDKFSKLPDAYTRLILQVLRGDKSAFVRDDELDQAWRIFTPLLHAIDDGKLKPIPYKAFSRGPSEYDDMIRKYGYVYAGDAYEWPSRENRGIEVNGK